MNVPERLKLAGEAVYESFYRHMGMAVTPWEDLNVRCCARLASGSAGRRS